jgi:hypothetical protein
MKIVLYKVNVFKTHIFGLLKNYNILVQDCLKKEALIFYHLYIFYNQVKAQSYMFLNVFS